MCVTWLTHVCCMTHSCVYHDSFMCVPWLIHVCNMCFHVTRCISHVHLLHVRHDSFICATRLMWSCTFDVHDVILYMWCTTCELLYVRHDSFMCVPWLIHMCNRNYVIMYIWYTWCHLVHVMHNLWASVCEGVRHDSPICATVLMLWWCTSSVCETWLIHMCNMTRPYVQQDSGCDDVHLLYVRPEIFIYATRLRYTCAFTHSYVRRHNSSMCVPCLIHVWHDSSICVPWLIRMCPGTHMDESCHTWINLQHMWVLTCAVDWKDSSECVTCLI